MRIKDGFGNFPPPTASANAPAKLSEGSGKVAAACAEMESIFIYHLLKEMRAAVPKSGLMGGGRAGEMYTDMMHAQLARDLAAGGGIGLSDVLLAQLAERSGKEPDQESGEKKTE